MLEVLYATVLEPDLLGRLVDVPPERVRLIEKNGVARPLAEPAPTPNRARRRSRRRQPLRPRSARCRPGSQPAAKAAGRRAGSAGRDHHPAERDAARFADDSGRRTGARPQSVERVALAAATNGASARARSASAWSPPNCRRW